jgi:hypothetical protein
MRQWYYFNKDMVVLDEELQKSKEWHPCKLPRDQERQQYFQVTLYQANIY